MVALDSQEKTPALGSSRTEGLPFWFMAGMAFAF